jgi:hypothetical protein
MILTQTPQFSVQDDLGVRDGIAPIPQWFNLPTTSQGELSPDFLDLDLDPTINNVFLRLRNLFHVSQDHELSTTHLHDLTCFVLHKLLVWSPSTTEPKSSNAIATSQCIRYAVALYMLIIHGPTYFSHAHLQSTLVMELKRYLEDIMPVFTVTHLHIALWVSIIGMAASHDVVTSGWFSAHATTLAHDQDLYTWADVCSCVEAVLWYKTQRGEEQFRRQWEEAMSTA